MELGLKGEVAIVTGSARGRYGLETMGIGGGQGITMIVERA